MSRKTEYVHNPCFLSANILKILGVFAENQKKLYHLIDEAIQFGNNIEEEFRIYTPTNELKWIRFLGFTEILQGKTVQLFGLIQDITDKKNTDLIAQKAYRDKVNLLDSIGDGFLAVNELGEVIFWNKKAELIFRKINTDVVHKPICHIFTIDDEHNLFKHIIDRKTLKSGNIVTEAYFQSINKWLEFRVYNADENDGVSIFITDITERIIHQQELNLSTERFQIITRITKDVIWDWNIISNQLFLGPLFESVFGYKLDTPYIEVSKWKEFVVKDYHNILLESISQSLENSDTNFWELRYDIVKFDGSIVHVHDKGVIIRDDEKKPIRMVGAITDLTEKINNEMYLNKLNHVLETRAKMLSTSNNDLEQFARLISIDLQDPIRSIVGFSELVIKNNVGKLNSKDLEYLEIINKNVIKMREFIRHLFEYSKVDKINDLSIEYFNLFEVVNEVIHSHKKKLRKFDYQFNLSFDKDFLVLGFKDAFSSIFYQLVDNSIKFRRKEQKLEISIELTLTQQNLFITFKDNGSGIKEEFIPSIFTIFKRYENGVLNGYGIGLAIVRKIVQYLNGTIEINSKEGIGTQFTICLPLLQNEKLLLL